MKKEDKGLSRRQFLAGSLLTAAAGILPHKLQAQAQTQAPSA